MSLLTSDQFLGKAARRKLGCEFSRARTISIISPRFASRTRGSVVLATPRRSNRPTPLASSSAIPRSERHLATNLILRGIAPPHRWDDPKTTRPLFGSCHSVLAKKSHFTPTTLVNHDEPNYSSPTIYWSASKNGLATGRFARRREPSAYQIRGSGVRQDGRG